MALLRATRVRVQNYRNIDDSGWIELDDVTSFVGRNESGKTAVLKALHKFNPATAEPYSAQREFPRDRFTRDFRDPADWAVCSVRFEIAESFMRELERHTDGGKPPSVVTATRSYDGSLRHEFEPVPEDPPVAPGEVAAAIDQFAAQIRRIPAPQAEQDEAFQQLRNELLAWSETSKDRIGAHGNLKSSEGAKLLQALRAEANGKSRSETADAVEQLLKQLAEPLRRAQTLPVDERLWAEVKEKLPVFIYFDDYGVLDSAVYLPRLIEDLQRDPHSPKVRTINAMFKHVQLTAQEIFELGQSQAERARHTGQQATPEMIKRDHETKELRSIKLSSASNDITRRFSEWWRQRRHQIRYNTDGDFFRIWVSDDRRPNVDIELENRSQGFQWFFSFYLVFLVESDEGHKDAILLLDEPGLHLHPTAQQELIGFFEELSKKNQILYTTHSPFLVDGEHLHRVRPVTEDETGHSRIATGEWPKDRETVFPLQAAAGYAMVRGLFQRRKNVLVEGMSEYYYLHVLSLQCRAAGRAALPEDVYITPCGGTKLVGHLASLFLGQGVRPLVLLDGDEAGRTRADALQKELYAGHEGAVLMLDSIFAAGSEIEDVIGHELILSSLADVLGRTITIDPSDRGTGSLTKQIKATAQRSGVMLPEGWKPEVARRLAAKWAAVDAKQLPAKAMENAEKLFAEISQRFEAMDKAKQALAN